MAKRGLSESPPASRKRRASIFSEEGSVTSRSSTSSKESSGPRSPSFASTTSSTSSSASDSSNYPHSATTKEDTASNHTIESISPGSQRLNLVRAATTPVSRIAMGGQYGLPSPKTREPSQDGAAILPNLANTFQRQASAPLTKFTTSDTFPIFKNGDVVIRTELGSAALTFQLHRSVLSRYSSWFAQALKPDAAEEAQPSWYLFKIEEINGKITLVRKSTNGERPATPQPNQLEVVDGVQIKVEDVSDEVLSTAPLSSTSSNATVVVRKVNPNVAVACYTQIFGIFYNIAPQVSTTDIGTTLVQSEELVKIAAELGCLCLLRPHLGNVFSQYRQALFLAIKSDPARWIQLAIVLENKSIYTECLVHLVGAHPCWPWLTRRTALSQDLRKLIAGKSEELDRMCVEAERGVLLATIHLGRGPLDPTERNQTETWLVVQVFRDLLAQRIDALDRDKRAALKRGTFFRAIVADKLEVLDSENVRKICQGTMNSDWKDLVEDLRSLKNYAAEVIAEVAANELLIDPDACGIGYLTCAKVELEEVPWLATTEKST